MKTQNTVAVLSEVRKAAKEEPTFLQAHNNWARKNGHKTIEEKSYRKATNKLKAMPPKFTITEWYDEELDDLIDDLIYD